MRYAQVVLADLESLLKLDPRQFQARMAVWQIMWEQERPCTDRDACRILGWNARGWSTVRDQLLKDGALRKVVGGYSVPECERELLAWAETQAGKAKDKLARTARTATERARLAREIERLIGIPHQFRHQADLFEADDVSLNSGGKANDISGRPSRAHAGAHEETGQFGQSLGKVSRNIHETFAKQSGNPSEKPSKINASTSRARGRDEKEKEKDKYNPSVSPHDDEEIETVDGELIDEDDEFTFARRKPGRPIPEDWTPDGAILSANVLALVERWPDGELEREGIKFVEDAHGADRRHRDWDRAYGVWLTKHDGYLKGGRRGRQSGWT